MSFTKLSFLATENIRLDKFLSNQLKDLSRMQVQRDIKDGMAFINGMQNVKCNALLSAGDRVDFEFCAIKPTMALNIDESEDKLPFRVIFEDEDLLIIDKKPGLVVHPGAGHHNDTLVDILLNHYKLSNVEGFYPGIVHRLDKDTSGLMIVAKNDIAHHKLAVQIAAKEIQRRYIALVFGTLIPPHGKIVYNIGKSSKDKTKMIVMRNGGKSAVTHYQTIKKFGMDALSLVELILETGRTHQIRVHMNYQKHPVIGDRLYIGAHNYSMQGLSCDAKKAIKKFPRQALHSKSLSFLHPIKNIEMNFSTDLPQDISDLIGILNKEENN